MTEKRVFDPKISAAIRAGDCAQLRQLIKAHPQHVNARTPFAGGTWLHYAAGLGNVEVAQELIELGFDVNQPGYMDGDLALCCAAGGGHVAMTRFLLDKGSKFDTSESVRNALFAAIVGKSLSVAKLLMERGLDASVTYNADTMADMDAIAFALWRGEKELAEIVALHLADGDEVRARGHLEKAAAVASRNAPLERVRIVPAAEDLSPD